MNIVVYGIRYVAADTERAVLEKAILHSAKECGLTKQFCENLRLTLIPSECRKLGSRKDEPYLEIKYEIHENAEVLKLAQKLREAGHNVCFLPTSEHFLPRIDR